MKKILPLILVLIMCVSLLSGCGPSTPPPATGNNPAPSEHSKVTINVGLTSPEGDFTDVVCDYFMKAIESADVNITIAKYNNGQLGNEASMVDQLFTDTLDVYLGNVSVLANALPIMYAFAMPFLTKDVNVMYEIMTDKNIFAETVRLCEEAGVHYMANAHVNPRGVSNHVRPIRVADDMKGLTIRTVTSSINVAALTALGANPVSTALGETYTALQQGVVDGTDSDMSMGSIQRFYEIDGFFTELNYQWAVISMVMSDECWNKLTDVQRTAVMDAAWKAQEYGYEIYAARQELSRKISYEMNPDLQIILAEDLTAAEYSTFTDRVVDIYKEYREIVGANYFDMIMARTTWASIF